MEDSLNYMIVKKGSDGYNPCKVIKHVVKKFECPGNSYQVRDIDHSSIGVNWLEKTNLIDCLKSSVRSLEENHYVMFDYVSADIKRQVENALKYLPFCFDEENPDNILAERIGRYFDFLSESSRKPWFNPVGKTAVLASLQI